MRLTAIFLTFSFMHVYASSAGQNVTLTGKELSFEKVLSAIRKQTGYGTFYKMELLEDCKPVSINVNNKPLMEFLQIITTDQPVNYYIENKTIYFIRKKVQTFDNTITAIAPVDLIRVRVVDSSGNPLPGATVGARGGTGVTSMTDGDGWVSLNVKEGEVLMASFVGYVTGSVRFTGGRSLVIRLKPAVAELSEMVITGYTPKKVSELTGAVQTISGKELRSGVSGANTLAMLKGKAAGLYIVESGGNSNGSVANRGQVIMRGQASLPDANNTNFGPLIVLDGVITTSDNLQDIVNPADIASITLLKDAASTAIYGSRAAQGVLLVTTNRGQSGKLTINLNAAYGKVQSKRLVDYMNTEQITTHIEKNMQALYNAPSVAGQTLRNKFGSFANYFSTASVFTEADRDKYYDWSGNAFFPDGRQSDINLSMSSGNERSRFYGAVTWQKQDGTLLDDRLDRKSIRLNIDQKINDKLSVSFNTNVIADTYTSSTGENQSYILQPWVTPYNADGTPADSIPQYPYAAAAGTGARNRFWYSNPLYRHELNTAITKRQNYLGTGIIKYTITPWLTAQSTNTLQYIYNNVNSYKDPRTFRGKYGGPASNMVLLNGDISINDTRSNYFLTSNLLTFNRQFGDHQISALAGQEYGKTHTEFTNVSAYNTPYPGERNLGAFLFNGAGIFTSSYISAGRPIVAPSSLPTLDKASFSIFSEINDNYKGKYFGAVSLRRDASTNFGKMNRYGTFYSVSGAWQVNKEEFMAGIKPVTNMKLRVSHGTSGREAGADFLNFTTYSESGSWAYDTITNIGAAIQRIANEEVTWETTYTTNIGLDLGLWNRVTLNVDVYNRTSKGLLQTVTLPTYQGGLTQVRNVGELQNRGIDINVSTVNIQKRNFSWTTDFNISFNQNKLVRLYGDSLRDAFTASYYRYVGEDINNLKAINYVGVNPQNGRPLFERVMPDKSIQIVDSIPLAKNGLASYKVQGSATPKFFGGFTSTFHYKGITLSTLFNFVYGNKIFNNSLRNFISPTIWMNGYNMLQPNESIRFWQGPGDTDANYPDYFDEAFSQRGATNINSSLLIQDASYIRLRNARLAYDLPADVMKKLKMSSASIYVSGDNLFVIKSGELFAADPEGATIGNSAANIYQGAGIWSAMPRRYLVGLNVGF